eukprot:TRINITY_DN2279_c0_g1_i1.p1 TRINITY_DN2279_c0_g1~~TRINITY_DN2279_c0_g1_i1.p1  ORF type:complete len:456 (+),score=112.97 TRINITY_DN2279_c0_g1_i1:68-1369(+)
MVGPEQLPTAVWQMQAVLQGTFAAPSAQLVWDQLAETGRIPARLRRRLDEPPSAYRMTWRAKHPPHQAPLILEPFPELAACPEALVSASPTHEEAAAVTVTGRLLWRTGYWPPHPRQAPIPAGWRAIQVDRALLQITTVLCRNGPRTAVYTWVGHDLVPNEVQGLPPDDPVVEIGKWTPVRAFALTASGQVYETGPQPGPAELVQNFCGLGVRRLASSRRAAAVNFWGVAETSVPVPELHMWVGHDSDSVIQMKRMHFDFVKFPLRSLAVGGDEVAIADARGHVWRATGDWFKPNFYRARLPNDERAMKVSVMDEHQTVADVWRVAVVVLTEKEQLLVVSGEPIAPVPVHNITYHKPELQGLVPFVGSGIGVALRDPSAGKGRLRLLARIAVHIGIPGDVVRAVISRLMVSERFFTGPENDPFCLPDESPAEL